MKARQLRAPADDGGCLSEPAPDGVPELAEHNRLSLSQWTYDFQGRAANRLRQLARAETLPLALRHLHRFGFPPPDSPALAADPTSLPWILTGHQPELFHPGVWVKNFAISGLARATRGISLNLIVDNDIPKAAAIRVPTTSPDGRLLTHWVDFDSWADESPFEDWTIRDESTFASFAQRALDLLGGRVADPLLRTDWTHAVAAAQVTPLVGLRLAAMRHAREAQWGVHNLEVPLGSLCETEAFAWFCSHLLAQLPRFQSVHNNALLDYRKRYRIRSRNHPVPELSADSQWLEAPFWGWRANRPRRRPLLALQATPRKILLRLAGEPDPFAELPLGPDQDACCAVTRLLELPSQGIRLRTRALTTTMFSRLLLGDLFLHGIGGAKYDELGDDILHRFFHIEPPPFWTLSLTQRLGITRSPASPDQLAELHRELRTLLYNPERWLGPEADPDFLLLAQRKAEAISGPTQTRADRIRRFHAIQQANRQLQTYVQDAIHRLQRKATHLQAGLAWNQVADSREYAWVLHSHDRLKASLLPWAEPSDGGPWATP